MKRATSLYLDVLRIFAAVGVFLGHVDFAWFSGEQVSLPSLGHELVIVFFFLSGYVMADATLGRRRSATEYVAARLSRLGSVVWPAVLLTAVLARVGTAIAPDFYAGFSRGHEGLREFAAAIFCSELWFFSGTPPANAPLWSLGYEFWYYALLGCWVYGGTGWRRWLLSAAVLAVAGPKIALLLPVWLLGVLGWVTREHWRMSATAARLGWAASGLAIGVLMASSWTWPGGELAVAPWFHAGRFLSDWVLGALVCVHVGCVAPAVRGGSLAPKLERAVRWGSGMTFSLYAYHFPLLVFFAGAVPYNRESTLEIWGMVAAIIAIIAGLHHVTERQRETLRRAFMALAGARWFAPRRPVVRAI